MRQSVICLLAVFTFGLTGPAAGQTSFTCRIRGPAEALAARPSPLDSVTVTLDGQVVKLCYGRPSARGRRVMGELVPYGQPWRLGANEPTTIHFPFAVEIGGVRVEPGTYSLYAIPGESTWEIVVNRAVNRWGIPINDAVRREDVGSARVSAERLEQPVETLTLSFAPPDGGQTALVIEWERTRVRVPIRKAR
ncbi:MAG TPA: DUF2911 domain-containing protein [Gemmatimonadales bacterium]|nr:DUF2911 domain-containing protein [Gemmatimonadales bacterium]